MFETDRTVYYMLFAIKLAGWIMDCVLKLAVARRAAKSRVMTWRMEKWRISMDYCDFACKRTTRRQVWWQVSFFFCTLWMDVHGSMDL